MTRAREKLKIIGIDCPSCVYSIKSSLSRLQNIYSVDIDPNSGEALVEYDDESVGLREIVRAVKYAGYDVYKEYYIFSMEDVDEDDVRLIEKILNRHKGVVDYKISQVTGILKIAINPYSTSIDEVSKHLSLRGFKVKLIDQETEIRAGRKPEYVLVIPILSFSIGLLLITTHLFKTFQISIPFVLENPYTYFILTSIVVLINYKIFTRGFRALYLLTPVMDSLIALSSGFTYIYSTLVLMNLVKGELFYEASAGVLGFVSLGKHIENRLKAREEESLTSLLELQRGRVRRIVNGSEEEVDVNMINVNDLVSIKAGERILVDGIVVDGWGYVDESTFTGESNPVYKSSEKRDPVYAGTVLLSGYLKVRVTRAGGDTLLSQIIEYVREAQASKPSVQRFADKIVGYLTWIVIILSLVTFIYWRFVMGVELDKAVLFTASVLAVTCPCPLGIAIPMVVAIAVVNAVKIGVMVRASDVFERTTGISVAMFDKTGTLTIGKPVVEEIVLFNNDDVLKYICSAEVRSEHVYAKAVLNYCVERGVDVIEPQEYEHIPGQGVLARCGDFEITLGSQKLMENLEINIDKDVLGIVNSYREKGRVVVYVALNKRLSGIIVLHDKIRDDARHLVGFFKNRGVKTIIATGDNFLTANAVAGEVGVDEVYSDLRPEDKADLIEKLQNHGFRVMYIGDGINDAIALKKAFIGIAMGSGAEISRQAGDVVVISDNLSSIIDLYELSLIVKRKGLENILWAFIYNAFLIPIAMGLLYPIYGLNLRPEFAALAMIMSDISVVANSLSLLKWKPSLNQFSSIS